MRPEIFISATSRDLKSCRQLVRDALLTLGCVPIVQDHFAPGAGEVRAALRERIKNCHAVIHLAGQCYGHEPREPVSGEPRRSYTQIEYDIARELKKPLYTFLCAPDFPYDAHEPEPADLRALQDAHRATLVSGNDLYVSIRNPHELSERVRELQTRTETLSRDLQKTRSWLGRGLAATAVGLLLVAGLLYGVKHQGAEARERAEARAAKAEEQLAALQNQLQQQTRLISLVSEKLDRNAASSAATGGTDPASVARAQTARDVGISQEELEAKLAQENTDLRALDSQVAAASDAAQARAAEWQKLRRDTLSKLGDAENVAGHYAAALESYQKALALTDKSKDPLAWCSAAGRFELVLWELGRTAEAEPLAKELVSRRTEMKGPDDQDTLRTVHNLANVLYAEGKFTEAEALNRRSVEAQERTLGKDHVDTLESIMCLANTLEAEGNYPAAEALDRRCLEALERTLGKDHIDTMRTMNNLANVLSDQGNNAEAESLYRRCLEGRERTLGKDHPETLHSIDNLGSLLTAQGNYLAAEPLHRRALEGYERTLGREHPDTLACATNLAANLDGEGDFAEAEALERRCLEIDERTLGKEHPDTLLSMSNLAETLCHEQKFAEAEPMDRRCLEAREHTLGKEHPDTLASVENLADLLTGKGDFPAAEALYLRAESAMAHVLPPEHPSRLATDYSFSVLREKQGRLREALPLAEQAATGAAKSFPAGSTERVKYEKNLADLRAQLAAASPPP